MALEQRGQVVELSKGMSTVNQEEHTMNGKPFAIDKNLVYQAWKQVKAAGGAPGVDGVTVEAYEANLKSNLYKLWNRMSSGSYMPKAVRRVEIPKAAGGVRPLGIPTVTDRVAQCAVMMLVDTELDRHFHVDSYGFRKGHSAHEAVAKCRERCFQYNWVLDIDIEKYFDSIDHALLLRAVEKHVQGHWARLYIERWLKAPIHMLDGKEEISEKGTPQGGVISPLLANLFLHYAFDMWMRRTHTKLPFERYADDIVVHCRTEKEATELRAALGERFAACGLRLHPDKTKVVYCKDSRRCAKYHEKTFSFLGFDFKPRRARSRDGKLYTVFTPGVSRNGQKRLVHVMRIWGIPRRTSESLEEIAKLVAPVLRGWMRYFQAFRPSEMYRVLYLLNRKLTDWYMKKYRTRRHKAIRALARMAADRPRLFPHWQYGILPLRPKHNWSTTRAV